MIRDLSQCGRLTPSRGAGCSKGRTSWTAKAELADYISFAGFFIHYLNRLSPSAPNSPVEYTPTLSGTPLSPIPSSTQVSDTAFQATSSRTILVLGGYSYGSLITTHLPTTEIILQQLSRVDDGTAAAEIRLRADHLSMQWNKEFQQHHEGHRGRSSLVISDAHRGGSHPIVVGGDESEHRRLSRESRRSLSIVRKSSDRSKKKLGFKNHGSEDDLGLQAAGDRVGFAGMPLPQTSYLLISPLLPPIASFATLFSKVTHHIRESSSGNYPASTRLVADIEEKLTEHKTFAIYGDNDFFTSQRKLKRWCESLAGQEGSLFQFREVGGAGHFWHEAGVEAEMRNAVRDWIQDVMSDEGG